MSDVRNDAAAQRYRLDLGGGEQAIAAYRLEGDTVVFTHTAVPPDRQGEGVASRLIAGALADVRAKGLRVVPQCPFVADYIDRHPDDADLVAG